MGRAREFERIGCRMTSKPILTVAGEGEVTARPKDCEESLDGHIRLPSLYVPW